MKKIILFTILSLLLVPIFANAQDKREALKATVTTNTKQLIVIEFSKKLSDDLQLYKVVGQNQTIMFGDGKLINRLHDEYGLLAFRVSVDQKIIKLEFSVRLPDESMRSNIINRVIKISHNTIDPKAKLELNGYDPLLGINIIIKKRNIPPPVARLKALPSGSEFID